MESNPTHKRKVVGFLLSLAGAIFLADSQKCVTAGSLLSLKAQQASVVWEHGESKELSARGEGRPGEEGPGGLGPRTRE